MGILGLTADEVASRQRQGLVNDYEPSPTRRVPVIIFRNFFIIFNILIAPLLAVLLMMGQYKDVLSVGAVALINTLINIVQEIQAKRALDRIRMENPATALVIRDGQRVSIPTHSIVEGDALVLHSGELVLADGPVLSARHLEMDESMLTGESDYIGKEVGATVLSGSFAVAGEGVYRAQTIGAGCYMQRIIGEGRKLEQKKTPVEKKVDLIVNGFIAFCFLMAAVLLLKFQPFNGTAADIAPIRYIVASVTTMIPQGLVLIVTITFALGVIAFAKRGIIFRKVNAVESLSNVDLICMDKTGTLTHNRIVLETIVAAGKMEEEGVRRLLAAFSGAALERNKTVDAIREGLPPVPCQPLGEIPFKSRNKFSALRITLAGDTHDLLLGAYEIIKGRLAGHDEALFAGLIREAEERGMRTLVFASSPGASGDFDESLSGLEPIAVIRFREAIKEEAPAILRGFAREGVGQVVISGDSLRTVQSIALQIGLPDADKGVSGPELEALDPEAFRKRVLASRIFARVKPEQKREIIRVFRAAGRYTAMVGDGVNDVLALKEADLAIAMGSGGSMAKDVSDIVLVNNRFDVLPDLLAEGDRIVSRIQDCARIFTLKNFYALFMIAGALLCGYTFPFFPQQITMLNFVTITIPLLYLIKFSRYKSKVSRSFLRDILLYSLSMGGVIAAVGIGVNVWQTASGIIPPGFVGMFGGQHAAAVRLAQSSALIPVIFLALTAYLYLSNRGGRFKDLFRDRKILCIVLGLFGAVLGLSQLTPVQKFFEIIPLSGDGWLRVLTFLIPGILIQRLVIGWLRRRGERRSGV